MCCQLRASASGTAAVADVPPGSGTTVYVPTPSVALAWRVRGARGKPRQPTRVRACTGADHNILAGADGRPRRRAAPAGGPAARRHGKLARELGWYTWVVAHPVCRLELAERATRRNCLERGRRPKRAWPTVSVQSVDTVVLLEVLCEDSFLPSSLAFVCVFVKSCENPFRCFLALELEGNFEKTRNFLRKRTFLLKICKFLVQRLKQFAMTCKACALFHFVPLFCADFVANV